MKRVSRRDTKFRPQWKDIYKWLEEVKDDQLSAKCTICNCVFRINSSGITQVKNHSTTKRHENLYREALSTGKLVLDANSNVSLKTIFSSKDEIVKAEILWALKCCVSNYSFNSNVGMSELFKEMFPDSKIASQYQMSYTKIHYIIQFGLKPYVFENLINDFENTPFTFKFDETTTVQVKKQYDGYVQYYSKKFEKIVNRYAGSLFLGHCFAEDLLDHFLEFGKNMKWNIAYLLHLGMDGPYLNLKFEDDLVKMLDRDHGKKILNIKTCSLHPVHTAFKTGLKFININLDKFIQDSSARRQDFKLANLESDLEVQYMLRYVTSRWLSRIDQQWDHLKEYFLKFLPKQKRFAIDIETTERYKNIKSMLSSDRTRVAINFVIYVADVLECYLIPLQTAEPKAHILYSKIGELFFKLMNCFVKEEFLLQDESRTRKEARDLAKMTLTDKNMISVHEMHTGIRTKFLVANLETKEDLLDLKLQFRSCYQNIYVYLQSHLPHDSTFLRNIEWIQPANKFVDRSTTGAKKSALTIATVLRNSKYISHSPETYADKVATEFAIYKTESIIYPGDPNDGPIENFWNFVGDIKDVDGNFKFKNLSTLALTCLSISHGNAVPERGFSVNKDMLESREAMSEQIIEAMRMVKESVALHGGITKFPITRRLITLVENSSRCYEQYLEDQKAKAAFEQARKAVNIELTTKETDTTPAEKQKGIVAIDLKIAEEKEKIKASDQLLANGKSILEKSITSTKVKKDDLLRANALFSMAMENSKIASEKLEELVEKKKDIEKTLKTKNTTKKLTSSHSSNTRKSTTKENSSSHSNTTRKSNTTKEKPSRHSNTTRKSTTASVK